MSRLESFREFAHRRLTAAAEQISGLCEEAVDEYEAEVSRLKEDTDRQRRLLDVTLQPEIKIHKTDSLKLPSMLLERSSSQGGDSLCKTSTVLIKPEPAGESSSELSRGEDSLCKTSNVLIKTEPAGESSSELSAL